MQEPEQRPVEMYGEHGQFVCHDRHRYEQAINGHLAAFQIVLGALEAAHQRRAYELDFDLVADTRPPAMWQMAGRCG
jgi:hypothetical protein